MNVVLCQHMYFFLFKYPWLKYTYVCMYIHNCYIIMTKGLLFHNTNVTLLIALKFVGNLGINFRFASPVTLISSCDLTTRLRPKWVLYIQTKFSNTRCRFISTNFRFYTHARRWMYYVYQKPWKWKQLINQCQHLFLLKVRYASYDVIILRILSTKHGFNSILSKFKKINKNIWKTINILINDLKKNVMIIIAFVSINVHTYILYLDNNNIQVLYIST